MTNPRLFALHRDRDISGVSGTAIVADGVCWPDGTVSIRWRGARPSTVSWNSVADAEHVHGHGGATRIVWDGPEPNTGPIPAGGLAEDCPRCPDDLAIPFICHGHPAECGPACAEGHTYTYRCALTPPPMDPATILGAAHQSTVHATPTPCGGFPDTCPNLRPVPADPPRHAGGLRCGCLTDAVQQDTVRTVPDTTRTPGTPPPGQSRTPETPQVNEQGQQDRAPDTGQDDALGVLLARLLRGAMLYEERLILREHVVQVHRRAEEAEAALARVRALTAQWQTAMRPGEPNPAASAVLAILDGSAADQHPTPCPPGGDCMACGECARCLAHQHPAEGGCYSRI
ncbi:hypothetical protein [Streptomyces sp. NRRL S-337]|uniref:hypothetical protein n=1 Tax=Streptomyces sp. NRRL S-337 TaxID=1463900 RepID=UPI0007C47934|nr:hypothetical protein [Streptomyces sp. NRRL S-337]